MLDPATLDAVHGVRRAGDLHDGVAEERANCMSHALAFALAVGSAPFIASALERSSVERRIPALWVFEFSMAAMYLSSAIFHGLPAGSAKVAFERVDRAAIYLFIAGSYSLFAIPALAEPTDWLAFGGIWLVACVGAVVSLVGRPRRPLWATAPYLAMGWLAILGVATQTGPMHPDNLMLLLLGGLAYSLGAGIHAMGARFRFGHLLWHLLVVLGSGLHLAAAVA